VVPGPLSAKFGADGPLIAPLELDVEAVRFDILVSCLLGRQMKKTKLLDAADEFRVEGVFFVCISAHFQSLNVFEEVCDKLGTVMRKWSIGA